VSGYPGISRSPCDVYTTLNRRGRNGGAPIVDRNGTVYTQLRLKQATHEYKDADAAAKALK